MTPATTETSATLEQQREQFRQEMTRRRDRTVTTIAYGVLLVGAVVILIALAMANWSVDGYARAKDILLFVNPFIGLVLGYFFQKAASEGRAEHAEQAAETAAGVATRAQIERQQTQGQLEQVREHSVEQREALGDLVAVLPAEPFEAEPAMRTKDLPEHTPDPEFTPRALAGVDAQRLQRALARARVVLEHKL